MTDAEVKSAVLMVTIAGLDTMHHRGDGNNAGSWKMRIRSMTITYEWDRLAGYWRVHGSTVSGDAKSAACPETHTWLWGDHSKPLWVVGLEHQHYPGKLVFDRGRS